LLDHHKGNQILAQLISANHVLAPARPSDGFGTAPATLKETRPTFRGTWALHDPNNATSCDDPRRRPENARPTTAKPLNLVVVQIDWTDDEEGILEKMPARFFRLKPGTAMPPDLSDVNLFELADGKAWHFGIEKMIAVSRSTLSPVITGFAESVKMKARYTTNSKESFAQWNTTPSVKIHFGRLDRVYTFGIRGTHYNVEHLQMWYPNQPAPCCGIVVRHPEWATHLAPLEHLPPGRSISFGRNPIETFFPDKGLSASTATLDSQFKGLYLNNLESHDDEKACAPGLKLLMDKLMQLSTVMSNPGAVAI
jgi:hypothetical protein